MRSAVLSPARVHGFPEGGDAECSLESRDPAVLVEREQPRLGLPYGGAPKSS